MIKKVNQINPIHLFLTVNYVLCRIHFKHYFLREPLSDFDSLAFSLLLPEEVALLSLLLLVADDFSLGADCRDDLVVSDRWVRSGLEELL